jgi:hypothetical protein
MEMAFWLKVARPALAAAIVLGGSAAVFAAGVFTNGVPPAGGTQYPSTIPLTGNETIPADTNLTGGQNPASEAITTSQLAVFGAGLPSGGNFLIGGDATTNLFQRGTTGPSVTTTFAYGPDRWAYWSGTGTAMTVSRDSATTDLSLGYKYAFVMQRTAAQTGVVQMCMAQEVESLNSYAFAGQTAELDFNAYTGANFSAAGANMTAYIVYGTGADEGIQKLAFGLNAGGGGSSGWTGQTNATAAVVNLGGVSTAGRYGAFASIPATATEVAAVLCYTPVGTAGANDYIAFEGIQLKRSNAAASYVNATLGYNSSQAPLSAFNRRTINEETLYQQRYYYTINESATSGTQQSAAGNGATTTTCQLYFPFPVTMRIAPTYSSSPNPLTTATFTITHVATATALATGFLAVLGANTINGASMTATVASGLTAGQTCVLTSANGSGQLIWSAEL